jgi:hypothetical protein
MKISYLLGVAGIAVLSTLAPAGADSLPSPSAVTVKVGGSLQSSGGDTSGLAAGVDYVLHPSSVLEPVNLSAYADLLGRGVGAGLAIRNGGPIYAGAGVGLYSVDSAAGLGGKVFGGFSIAPRTTLELGYNFLPQVDGMQRNTVTLGVGLHL